MYACFCPFLVWFLTLLDVFWEKVWIGLDTWGSERKLRTLLFSWATTGDDHRRGFCTNLVYHKVGPLVLWYIKSVLWFYLASCWIFWSIVNAIYMRLLSIYAHPELFYFLYICKFYLLFLVSFYLSSSTNILVYLLPRSASIDSQSLQAELLLVCSSQGLRSSTL